MTVCAGKDPITGRKVYRKGAHGDLFFRRTTDKVTSRRLDAVRAPGNPGASGRRHFSSDMIVPVPQLPMVELPLYGDDHERGDLAP